MKRVLLMSLVLVSVLGVSGIAQVGTDTTLFTDKQLTLWHILNNPIGFFQEQSGTQLPEFNVPLALNFKGGGAREAGMGNACLALSDDVSAVSWNPAGLYNRDNPLERPVMGLSYKSFAPDAKFHITTFALDERYTGDDLFGRIGQASLLFPVRVKAHPLVFSAAYTALGDEYYSSGLHYDTYVDYTPLNPEDPSSNLAFIDFKSQLHTAVTAVNIGIGTRLYDRLSMGAAMNVFIGKAFRNQTTITGADSMMNQYDLRSDVPFGTPLASDLQRVDRRSIIQQIDTSSYSGYYFNFGLKYLGDKFSAGLSIKPPHTLKQVTDYKTTTLNTTNGNVIGSDTTYVDDRLIEIEMPFMIGGGVAYNVTEKLLFAMDMEYRAFEGKKLKIRDSLLLIPGAADKEFFTETDPYWNNVFAMRFGAEYSWETGNRLFPMVPVRAGFALIPLAAPNVDAIKYEYADDGQVLTAIPTSTSKATSKEFSLGAGVRWEYIYIDAAWTRSSVDRSTDFGSETVWDEDKSSSEFQFTFTGYF